uniref:Transposase Tc1-like domain-containing protein n=1 Tax=Erpetoichthys calabaricus TaxID=27687 RepID=A0A8C4SHN1_ERPCA
MRTEVIGIYQSGKGYKAISKALGLQRTTVRAIIHKWQKHGTVVNLPRSGRTTKITPRATTSKELQASLASIKVSVHDSTIRKRLGKNGLHGRCPRRKPLLSKKNIRARLNFAKKHLNDCQDFWENTLWTDETKLNYNNFAKMSGPKFLQSAVKDSLQVIANA